jgi:aminoglycoside phosphotransferase (APT) family kinase protein
VARKLAQRPERLDDSIEEGRIRAALEPVWPLPQPNRTSLLHCDYWPGNLLWRGGQLAAVIDWEDAALGDPLADLASSRLELLWAFGLNAMQQFTQTYLTCNPIDVANLPYWDLYAALRPAFQLSQWAADSAAEANLRALHHQFITQAFAALNL